jgi:hypothetical protein
VLKISILHLYNNDKNTVEGIGLMTTFNKNRFQIIPFLKPFTQTLIFKEEKDT